MGKFCKQSYTIEINSVVLCHNKKSSTYHVREGVRVVVSLDESEYNQGDVT